MLDLLQNIGSESESRICILVFEKEIRILTFLNKMATGGQTSLERDDAGENIIESGVLVRSVCGYCDKTGTYNQSSFFCEMCEASLRDKCIKSQSLYEPGAASVDKALVDALMDMKVMKICNEHHKKITIYCKDHERACCLECALNMHIYCAKADLIEHISKQQSLEKLIMSLNEAKTDILSIKNDCKLLKANTKVSIETIKKRLAELYELQHQINILFQEASRNVWCKAHEFQTEEIKHLEEKCLTVDKVSDNIHQLLQVCSHALAEGKPKLKIITSKMVEKELKTIEACINKQTKSQKNSDVPCSLLLELATMLENGNKLIASMKNRPTIQESKCESTGSENSLSVCAKVVLQQLKSVEIKQNEGDKKVPYVSGLDFLPDGRLVALDNANKTCFILNDRLEIQGLPYQFKNYPFNVLCLSKYEFVVTAELQTLCIMFLSPDNDISLLMEINTSSQFFSICYFTQSQWVVSACNDSRPVRMVTDEGVESDFEDVKFPSRKYTIRDIMCTYVKSRNTLVLTDRFNNIVYMYDTVKGTDRAVMDENIQQPWGPCVGPGDTVLVCSRLKNSIVHLTVDGNVLAIYPVDVMFPNSLCMSRNGTRLAVAGENKLLLFRIKLA